MFRVPPLDALKTYRYLRLGILGAVLLLGISIGREILDSECLQNSISAYYYTPVRAVFVGALFAVGLSLIVYKGTVWEDRWLTLAGALAPVVAIAPTINVNKECGVLAPNPLPRVGEDGPVAEWVKVNVNGNFRALLVAGAIGVAAAAFIWLREKEREGGAVTSMALAAFALGAGWWLLVNWGAFYKGGAHFGAAILMFVFLALAVFANAVAKGEDGESIHSRGDKKTGYKKTYLIMGALMPTGALAIAALQLWRIWGDHLVFALEAFEIAVFAAYWLVQTIENWEFKTESLARAQGA